MWPSRLCLLTLLFMFHHPPSGPRSSPPNLIFLSSNLPCSFLPLGLGLVLSSNELFPLFLTQEEYLPHVNSKSSPWYNSNTIRKTKCSKYLLNGWLNLATPTEEENTRTEMYFYPHSEIFARDHLGREGRRRQIDSVEYREGRREGA